MSLSIKESEKLRKFIKTIQKNRIRDQNTDPHSAASTRIAGSSNPSWSPPPGTVDRSGQSSESTSKKRRTRKNKNRGLEDAIQKHIEEILDKKQIQLLKPLNMTTEVCVSNGHCFPPRRVTNGHPIPVGDRLLRVVLRVAFSFTFLSLSISKRGSTVK